jgi:hypothetical protein
MKINHQVIKAVAAFISVSSVHSTPLPLYNPDTARDFFSSPLSITTSITLAPLKSFFDAAQEKTSITDPEFFSRGFSAFIQKNYNQSDYADTLSRDGRQVTEFLVLSNQYNFSTEQTYTGLRLFHNKFKETGLVDDTVMEVILKTLPVELDRHFPLNPLHSAKQKSPAKMVENIILTEFTDHLTKPTTSTEHFFSGLSQTIASSLKEVGANDEMEMRNRLRTLTIKFVDLLLTKTMWYPQHPESIWPSVLQAANSISQLCSSNIINHLDDADELYKTLISRFVWFIEQFGSQMPVSWFDTVEGDVSGRLVPFLESVELDEGIRTKKQSLLAALARGKTLAIAQQTHGLLLD